MWDIGAGSGSVSIETARLCPGVRVYAVDKDGEQIRCINENRDRFKVSNIETVQGEAPGVLMNLPAPDRVFIGGSSGRLEEIIRTIKSSHASKDPLPLPTGQAGVTRHPSLIIVINATTIETLNEAVQSLENNDFKVDVSEVSVSRSKIVGGKKHMSALNPVFIVTGEKTII